LVLLHGFTQTGRLWGPFGEALAQHFTLIGIDLPGHAGSDSIRADLPTTAELVTDCVVAAIGPDPCHLLGYSLGARVALHVALQDSLAVRRMVVIGATGGIPDANIRQQRRQRDEAAAAELESSPSADIEPFIDRWISGPMFAGLGASAQREERLRNSAAGLASSLRLAGTGTQAPLWDELASIPTPILALAGTDDARFCALALHLTRVLPNGAATFVPGGGHAVHLAQPATTARLVDHWLAITSSPPQSPP
jgi:2-succinyl-6-hydroxy-2,4-cyclohexadiene-1-carboxylate synthase